MKHRTQQLIVVALAASPGLANAQRTPVPLPPNTGPTPQESSRAVDDGASDRSERFPAFTMERGTEVVLEVSVGVDPLAVAGDHSLQARSHRPFGPAGFTLIELDGGALLDRSRLVEIAGDPRVRFVTPTFQSELGLPDAPTRHVLVRFEPQVSLELQRASIDAIGGLIPVESDFGGMDGAWRLVSSFDTGPEVLEQVDRLARAPGVRWAEPDAIRSAVLDDVLPNDPLWPNCWGLENPGPVTGQPGTTGWSLDFDMDVARAWDRETGDSSIVVVVLDTGVEQNHPDINQIPGQDFTGSGGGGGPVSAGDCHGTAVAGCVSAILNNGIGTVGVAPGSRIASAKVITTSNTGGCNPTTVSISSSGLINALEWADDIGARVTCSSFSTSESDALTDAYADAWNSLIVNFAATGNSGTSGVGYPARLVAVLAIGSAAPGGGVAPSSTTGPEVFAIAPGSGIQTTDRIGSAGYNTAAGAAGDYTIASGTSFAAPYAAGVAALMLSIDPDLKPSYVRDLLSASAADIGSEGKDNSSGFGLLNAAQAIEHVGDTYLVKDEWAWGAGSFAEPANNFEKAMSDLAEGGVLILIDPASAPGEYDWNIGVWDKEGTILAPASKGSPFVN